LLWKWALHLLHRNQSGWADGGASAEGAAAVVGCVDGAVCACKGGDGDGAGDEAGEGEGRSEGKGDIENNVVMAGYISDVCSVIHSSLGMLGVILLLVGVKGLRSEHVEVLLPSSWGSCADWQRLLICCWHVCLWH
jgi:hypothetical protein